MGQTIFRIEQKIQMKRLWIYGMFLVLSATTTLYAQFRVSETKYDYTSIAQQITLGAVSKLEQARNIYQWICRNIAYDTTYQIYTADECWDKRQGVCQAYCELFYRLAEPLGINTVIIFGKTKDMHGNVSAKGHSWLLVEVEDGWIFVDPTWGAGGIKDNVFQRKENDMSWFHVDPYWLIFTHYPDEERFQFLEVPINWKTFVRLPTVYPALGEFGWNGKDIWTKVMSGKVKSFPVFHEKYVSNLSLLDIPMQEVLRPGRYYIFCVKKKKNASIALIHNEEFVKEAKWERNGDDYMLCYMPVSAGTLKISVSETEKVYNTVVNYQVASPSRVELKVIEKYRPFRMPELKAVKNLDIERLKEIGMDGAALLAEARRSKITSLPVLYKDAETMLADVDVPFSEKLHIGKAYTFSFVPKGGLDWQIINEKDWYGEWDINPETGRISIVVIPKHKGRLKISVQMREGSSYSTMLGYQVVE